MNFCAVIFAAILVTTTSLPLSDRDLGPHHQDHEPYRKSTDVTDEALLESDQKVENVDATEDAAGVQKPSPVPQLI